MSPGALEAIADAADALARLARAALTEQADASSTLVPLREAARRAATSPRVVRDAIKQGELAAFGRQRDRAVRVEDLSLWIESRRAKRVTASESMHERAARRFERATKTKP